MCRDCGCSSSTPQEPARAFASSRASAPPHRPTKTLEVHESLLSKNDHQAHYNRERFAQSGLKVLNLMSSPGSGKTTLLERTLDALAGRLRVAVIVGDLATDNDARRLRGRGAEVASVTTGTLCHLDAAMIAKAAAEFDLSTLDLLIIENVGNLVCPAVFDLGEELRVVMLSTTEGEDKPLKYPVAFKSADLIVLNKLDLAEAVDFDWSAARSNLHQVAPQATVIELSAKTGTQFERWLECLYRLCHAPRSNPRRKEDTRVVSQVSSMHTTT